MQHVVGQPEHLQHKVFLSLKQSLMPTYFSATRKIRDGTSDTNKHLLKSNADGYGCKTHYTGSEDSNTMTPSGKKLYYLLLSVLAMSSETA